jgi:hypothetical protein
MCEHKTYKTYALELLPEDKHLLSKYEDWEIAPDDKNSNMMQGVYGICDECDYHCYICHKCDSIKKIILIAGDLYLNEIFERMPELDYSSCTDIYVPGEEESDSSLWSNSSEWSNSTFHNESFSTKNFDLLKSYTRSLNCTEFLDISSLNLRWTERCTRITGCDGGHYFIMKCETCDEYSACNDK